MFPKLLAVVTNIIADLEAGLFWGGLFCEPASGERLLHAGGDKDTAFTVLR